MHSQPKRTFFIEIYLNDCELPINDLIRSVIIKYWNLKLISLEWIRQNACAC